MNYKLLNYEVMKIVNNRQRYAKQKAENNLAIAFKSPKFEQAYKRRLALVPEIAKKNVNHLDSNDLKAQYELLSTIINEELKKINFTEDDITPIYFCKKCQDTGIVDGVKCQCYFEIIDELKKRELNSTQINKKGLNSISDEIICDEQKPIYNKLLKVLKDTVNSFPNIARNFIVFSGATGSGKTYLANAMICDFENKGFNVLSLSSFALNNAFLKYHTTFDGSAIDILQPIFDCDVLMIDDLGTEPFFKNITNEYLISVINERTKVGKLTLVTTNLDSEKIIKRYSSRIASRLSDVNCSRVIDFKFADLRYPKLDK